ncbi:MAG: vWA domain-containing protein [bacterium]
MKQKNKKAQFVEIDFFLAIIILALGLIMLTEPFIQTKEDIQTDRLSYDAITLLSEMNIQDFNQTIKNQIFTDANNLDVNLQEDDSIVSALTKIIIKQEQDPNAELFNLAEVIINNTFINFLPERYKYDVTIFSGDEIYNIIEVEEDQKTQLASQSRTMLTGLEVGKPVSGYVASASLKEAKITDSIYEFIGGFIGQGNLTFKINIPSNEIKNMNIEGLFQDNFDIIVNNQICQNINSGFINQELTSCVSQLSEGLNNISIKFLGDDITQHYVSGGIIKIDYNMTQTPQTNNQNTITKIKRIPDVTGIINIYDSIYVPGRLENMTLHLDYDTNIQFEEDINEEDMDTRLIMTLGNETIYSSNQNQENNELTMNLNLGQNYEMQTIPYRLGFLNLSTTIRSGQPVDLVLITDQSGSMRSQVYLDDDFDRNLCGWGDNTNRVTRGELAACLTRDFINELLIEEADVRMGIVGFESEVRTSNIINLTNDSQELLNFVNNNMHPGSGATCISCGIAASINLLTQSPQERKKVIILMSDGEATERYDEDEAPPSNTEIIRTYPRRRGNITTSESMNHAVHYAQYPKEEMNTTIYSISFFGNNPAQQMLQDISTDTNEYYFSGDDADSLSNVYQSIAQDIINVGYISQLLDVTPESFDVFNTSLKNSYIEYTYVPTTESHEGRIKINQEESFNNNNCERTFDLNFNDVEMGTGFITSYSGNIWTTHAQVNDNEIFNVLNYGATLGELGDPFVIGIPQNLNPANNEISLTLNDGSDNMAECNENNKLFYDIYLPAIFSERDVKEISEGCTWSYEYESESRTINIPSDYEGTNTCTLNDHDEDDVMQALGYDILSSLSHNNELMIDLTNSDFKISTALIDDIPYMWGPALIGVTIWR